MTAKQDALYWREWGALTRRCKADSMAPPDRHELHAKALGADKGHKEFTNADFDKVLAEFQVWSMPGDVRAQMRQADQPLTRLRYRIRELGDDRLVAKLVQDRFAWSVWLRKHYPEAEGVALAHAPASIVAEYRDAAPRADLDDLVEWQLEQLRDTLCGMQPKKTRARKPKAAEPEKLAEQARAECPY